MAALFPRRLVIPVVILIIAIVIFVQGAQSMFRPKQYLDRTFGHSSLYRPPGPLTLRAAQVIGLGLILGSLLVMFFVVRFLVIPH